MADSDDLINAAASRTESLISLAGMNAYDAARSAWNYKGAVDGGGGGFNWFGGGTGSAHKVTESYTIGSPITLPVERPIYTPQPDISNEFRQAFEEAFGMFHADMESGLAEYLANWFPATVATRVDDWIGDTILTGGRGIPADIEALIWQRARGRESQEALKLEAEAMDQFAKRGFGLPTGALASRLLQIQQEASLKAGTLSREIALKTFDAYREDIKFAVSEGAKTRISVLGALGDFLRAWTAPQQGATEIAKVKIESKSRLVSTAADYYRAIVSEAELNLKAHSIMASSYDTTQALKVQQDFQSEKLGSDASMETAKIFGSMASSAATSLVSLVGSEKQLLGAIAD